MRSASAEKFGSVGLLVRVITLSVEAFAGGWGYGAAPLAFLAEEALEQGIR